MSLTKTDSSRIVAAIFIAVATFALYLPSLHNGFVNWDDPAYILENARIRTLDLDLFGWVFVHVVNSNWHPLTVISYAVDYSIWGTDPWGYHLVNIVFHALDTFLVFFLAFRLVAVKSVPGSQTPFFAAAAAALLFGLHPIHVESVSWVSERKDVLCGFFYILTLLMYLRYAGKEGSGKTFYYLLALLFFALSLLSKPMSVTLPVVLMILDFYPLERLGSGKKLRLLIEKAPFFLLAAVSAALTIYAQSAEGAVMAFDNFPIAMRVLLSIKGFVFYLYKMIFPLWLSPYYPPPLKASLLDPMFIISLLVLCAVSAFAIVTAARYKVFISVWLFYIVTLLPVIGILQVGGQAAADRYAYLPSIGLSILAGYAAARLFEKRKIIAVGLAVVIALLLSLKTIRQQSVWSGPLTLWTEAIRQYPLSVPLLYNNRGLAYNRLGEYSKAIEDFDIAIGIDPSYFYSYINRGLSYGRTNRLEEALKDFDRGLSLKPDFATGYMYRATASFNLGRYSDAVEDLSKAIALNPGYSEAYNKRGSAYLTLGNATAAAGDFKRASELGYKK